MRSIVLFTDRPVREWCNLFEMDNILPTALIDRLMQCEEAIVIQGASYRMRDNATDSPSA
jgi:DNA replication protein DnaC